MEATETDRKGTPPAGSGAATKPQWRSLRESSRPLFLLSRVWGFAPFSVRQYDPAAQKSSLMYSTCVASVLIATHVATIFFEVSTNGPPYRHVRYVTRTGVVIFNRLCGIGNLLFLLTHRKMILSAVISVLALDEEWKPPGNEKATTFIYVELASMHSLIIMDFYSRLPQFISWSSLLFGIWQIVAAIESLSLLILQWTDLVYSLARHMNSLNDELAKQYRESNGTYTRQTMPLKEDWMLFLIENEINQGSRGKFQSGRESAQTFSNISSLRRHHRDIYHSLQKLQAAYGGPLAIGCTEILVNSVNEVFRLKNSFINPNILLSWILWKILLLWLVVFPCQMLLDETQKCADILHSAMRKDIPSRERKRLDNRKLISVSSNLLLPGMK